MRKWLKTLFPPPVRGLVDICVTDKDGDSRVVTLEVWLVERQGDRVRVQFVTGGAGYGADAFQGVMGEWLPESQVRWMEGV